MVQRQSFGVQETFQSSDLISNSSCEFLSRHLDLASSETLDIWKAKMRANGNIVGFTEENSLMHDQEITVKPK